MASQSVSFEDFELSPDSFELRRGGRVVELEPQEFSILNFLVANQDRVVGKEELLDEVWGHQYVTDAAISTRIKGIRKALDDDGRQQRLIQTVRGRGFRFVGEAERVKGAEVVQSPVRIRTNLPRERTPMFGRGDLRERCRLALTGSRLVSLLGIGGSGKTRLAIAVGHAAQDQFPDGVWFVDLVPCSGQDQIETALADAVGVAVGGPDPTEALIQALATRHLAIVLDNCEHAIDDVAAVVDRILDRTANIHFLNTSRIPLELADEVRVPIGALATEQRGAELAPAVAMFTACANRLGCPIGDDENERVRDICEHLDGLPLAIDLAAAQLRYLSLADLSARLDRRFELLARQPEQGAERGSSLTGVLEYTYGLLDDTERELLGQLAQFPGTFDFAAVDGVAAGRIGGLVPAFASLVDKALLVRTESDGRRWRMLETVRMFVQERADQETLNAYRQHHAQWLLDAFEIPLEDSFFDFAQAWWCMEHFADLTSAERFLFDQGRYADGAHLLIRQSLAMLQDLGPRAISNLARLELYPEKLDDPVMRAKIHGCGVFFSRGAGALERMVHHSNQAVEVGREVDDLYTRGFSRFMGIWTRLTDPDTMHALDEIEEIDWHQNNASRDAIALFRGYVLANQGRWEEVAESLTPLTERVLAEAPELITYASSTSVGLWALALIFSDPVGGLAAMQHKDREQPQALLETTLFYMRALVAASAGRVDLVFEICDYVRERQSRAHYSYASEVLLPCVVLAWKLGDDERARAWLSYALPAGGTTNLLPLGAARVCTLYPDVQESGATPAERNAAADEAIIWVQQQLG